MLSVNKELHIIVDVVKFCGRKGDVHSAFLEGDFSVSAFVLISQK